MIIFSGASCLRQRIILSVLSGKPLKIEDIRSSEENLGLKEYEILFLKLIQKVTNGSTVELNVTGTCITFRPGPIHGGAVEFDCGVERSIPYYLEPLLVLAPFSKNAFRLKLKGLTCDNLDQTIDGLKSGSLKILSYFGISEGLDLKILKRGAPPQGGGLIEFVCPVVANLSPIDLCDPGSIKKIRGIAAAMRISPQVTSRLIETAKSDLERLTSNVYIFSDVYKGTESGLSPGYSLFLQAESTTGGVLSVDKTAVPGELPEDLAHSVTVQLLKQIKKGGVFDQASQWLVVLLMGLTNDQLSKVVFGPLTPMTSQLLDDIQRFLGVSFKIKANETSGETRLSCIGSGASCNVALAMDILARFQHQLVESIYWIEPEVFHEFMRKNQLARPDSGNHSCRRRSSSIKTKGNGLFCEHCLYSIYNQTT